MTDRPTPSSLDSEQIVIGNIMLKPEAFRELESLTPAHFFDHRNQVIFTALNEMDAEGTPIDTYTLKATLESRVELAKAGGEAYLADLTSNVAQRAHLAHHVRILVEKKQRRDLLMVAHKLMTIAYEPTSSVPKTLEMAQEQLMKISTETNAKEVEIFVPVTDFVKTGKSSVEWRVERVIEKGTNGLIQALPKTGKSMMTCYLAACLATGYPFFDLDVQRCRVALISREDNPGTTARRLFRIFKGMGMDPEQNSYGNWLYVNSRAQSKSLMLDNPTELNSLIKNLQRKNSEFAVIDVFNTVHQKKENDPTEMAAVMAKVKLIHSETGCQICVVHHVRKGAGEDSLSERGRGTNAIAGFAEFIVDLDMADEEKEIRQARFLTKAAGKLAPFFWVINDLDNDGGVKLERTQYENSKRRAAKA